jgi:hypothetical protein
VWSSYGSGASMPWWRTRALFFFFFLDRVSLCSLGCPGTYSVDQADLELRNPPASASQVLGLKVCVTTAQQGVSIFNPSVRIHTIKKKIHTINFQTCSTFCISSFHHKVSINLAGKQLNALASRGPLVFLGDFLSFPSLALIPPGSVFVASTVAHQKPHQSFFT